MKTAIRSIKPGAALAAFAMSFGAWAQTLESPPAPEVGDKWTFRHHNKGDKREPYLFSNQVKTVDDRSAWIFSDSQEPNAARPQAVWRFDLKRAEYLERFESDPASANGAGKSLVNREANPQWLQFPLTVGKKYKTSFTWDNKRGFDEYDAEVQAFEKVKVEAGEFDAYRVRFSGFWNQREGGNWSGRTERMVWYAPAIKGSVKWTYTNRNSNGSSWNDTMTELVKWEPAPAK